MPWARSAWNWLTGLAWWLTNDWRNPPDCRERLSAAEAYFHHEGYADRSLWQAAQAELAREVRRSDRWQFAACVAIALLVLAGLAHAQSGTLGPQGKYYYSQGGDRAVKVTDGGTDARTVAAARYNLNVPCRHCADSLAANWAMTGSIKLPFTYWRDTSGVFTDDADSTKKVKLQLSGVGAGTTRWLFAPNRSGVIALENGASFTGATILDSWIDRTGMRAIDATFRIKDDADTTKAFVFQASSIPTGTTRTLTAPDANGIIAVRNNLLSIDHTDTQAASVVRGDLMYGNSTPQWSRLAVGASGGYLASDGTSAAWADLATAVSGFGYLTSSSTPTLSGPWAFDGGTTFYVDDGLTQFNANDLNADPVIFDIYDANQSASIHIKGPGHPPAADVTQRLQDRDGIILVRSDSLNRGGQVASIGTTTFSTAPGAGIYQVNFILESTATAIGGSVSLTIGWTDDAGATTSTTSTLPLTGAGRLSAAPLQIYVASGNVTYSTTVTGLVGTPSYTVRLRLVPLG